MTELRKKCQCLREKFTQLHKVPSAVNSSVSALLELYVPAPGDWFCWVCDWCSISTSFTCHDSICHWSYMVCHDYWN